MRHSSLLHTSKTHLPWNHRIIELEEASKAIESDVVCTEEESWILPIAQALVHICSAENGNGSYLYPYVQAVYVQMGPLIFLDSHLPIMIAG